MKERIIYKHVAVLGLDGMGNFCREADTPCFDRIFENGATTYYAYSMIPTISAENWGAMLLGAEPLTHGLTNSIVGKYEYKNKALPSVFTRIRQKHPDAVLTSICNWNPINHGIVEHDINVRMETGDNDKEICDKIIAAVQEKPEFLFVQFDDPDGAGHHFGYGTDDHLKKITEVEGYVGKVYDEYEKLGILEDTLFVVLADHGGRGRSHGAYSDTEKYVFLGVSGKGIEKSEIKYAQTVDIAAIVLYALGIEYPEHDEKAFASQIPEGIFPWYDGKYNKVESRPYLPETKPTPAFKADDGLTAYFNEDRIKLACFFDNELKDETGKCKINETGVCKYYSDGIRGERIELGKTGFAVVDGIDFGDTSFTAAFWLKLDRSMMGEPAIIGNKNWNEGSRKGRGFVIAFRSDDTIINVGCGDDDDDYVTAYPKDISDGWVHCVFTIDREAKEIRVYYNFKLAHSVKLEPQFDVSYDELPFAIGNDGSGAISKKQVDDIFNIDDLFIFDGAFSDDDVAQLKKYYE